MKKTTRRESKLLDLLDERDAELRSAKSVASELYARVRTLEEAAKAPVPLVLTCPARGCGERHIDEGPWATREHHTHSCQHCGLTWRPAIVNTVGVRFLPGFKNQ